MELNNDRGHRQASLLLGHLSVADDERYFSPHTPTCTCPAVVKNKTKQKTKNKTQKNPTNQTKTQLMRLFSAATVGLTQKADELQALISLHRLPVADWRQSLEGAVLFMVGLFPRPPSSLLGTSPPPGQRMLG